MITPSEAIDRLSIAGFPWPWRVACGGMEVPFLQDGKTYIYVWNQKSKTHGYYCFNDDVFITDVEFHDRRGF